MMNVLVIGSRGQTGRKVVDALAAKTDLATVRAAVREVSNASQVLFDWNKPDTWPGALRGIDAVYMVKPTENLTKQTGADTVETLQSFLNEARDVRTVVLLSEIGAEDRDETLDERRAERAIEQLSCNWTVLRPHWFMQNFADPNYYLAAIRDGSLIQVPTGGQRTSFVDTRDIADVAVACLLDDAHAGMHYTLTGPSAISWYDAATMISKSAGHRVDYVDTPLDEFIGRLPLIALPDHVVSHHKEVYRFLRSEAASRVSPDVERVLGHPPRDFENFVMECTDLWKRAAA